MSELNREQIVKGLECCSDDNSCYTADCPYKSDSLSACTSKLAKEALALIKELTEENEAIAKLLVEKTVTVIEFDKQIERLTEENEKLKKDNEWISVKDRLPDNYRAVLVVCESTSIGGGTLRVIGSYGGGFWSLADANGTHYLTKYMHYVVTHWMELPKVPKGDMDNVR